MKMIFASTADSLYSVPYCTSDWISTPLTQVDTCQVNDSDVIKTFFETKTKTLKFFQDQLLRPRPSLVFKTKTKTLHLKTKTFLRCILEADRKAFFFFGRKQKCQRKWNSIYGRKRNKNENGHSFSTEKRKWKSHAHSDTESALQCTANTSPSFAFLQVVLVRSPSLYLLARPPRFFPIV